MAAAAPSTPPSLLVIRGGAIGDFILTLPAIRLLRENVPQARIEILGYRPVIELALAGGYADSLRNLEHGSMAKLFVPQTEIDAALVSYFRQFTLVVSYLFDPDGFFRGNMERIGVKTFLEASHRVQPGQGHAAEQLARPLEKIAFFLDDPAPRLQLPAAALPPDTIAIHLGSGSLQKNLPLDLWVATMRSIRAQHPQATLAVITGEAEAERGLTAAFLQAASGLEFLHWDQMPLSDLAAHLTGCVAFLGHDSGISHLAAACGVPCLLFFGPTDPSLWAPRNPGVTVVQAPSGNLGNLDTLAVSTAVDAFLRRVLLENPLAQP